MDRDEVLVEVDRAAELFDGLAVDCCDEPGRVKWESRANALRAAAELIRAGDKAAEAMELVAWAQSRRANVIWGDRPTVILPTNDAITGDTLIDTLRRAKEASRG